MLFIIHSHLQMVLLDYQKDIFLGFPGAFAVKLFTIAITS
jgi:hypothetical protein